MLFLAAVHPVRCGCLTGSKYPSYKWPWVRPPQSRNPTFLLVQCKLEQQACLSSKQLTVRCEGPCPCPTEQASPSATDGKPGNKECWAPARLGEASLPVPPGAPPSGLWDAKRGSQSRKGDGKNWDRPEDLWAWGYREHALCDFSARGCGGRKMGEDGRGPLISHPLPS